MNDLIGRTRSASVGSMTGGATAVSDQVVTSASGHVGKARRWSASSSPVWDLIPVAVSLAASVIVIVRSATTVAGHRAYLLFDDAAISLTYARNLANGHGLVWVAGQHPVEGYSNFLWTMWMAAIEMVRPSNYLVGLWVMITGAALLMANTYVIARIARRLAPDVAVAPLLAGLATALYYGLNSWTLVGMETGLVALLASSAVLCALRSTDPTTIESKRPLVLVGTGILLALSLLTRDDALIVTVITMGYVFLRSTDRIRSSTLVGAPVLLALIGHEAFRVAYYGYLVPNTYFLKATGIPLATRLHRGIALLTQTATMQLVVPLVLAACYFYVTWRAGRRPVDGSVLLVVIVSVQAVYVVYIGGDSYDTTFSDRYIAPLAPFLFVVAVLGSIELARLAKDRRAPLAIAGVAVALSGLFVVGGFVPIAELQELGAPAVHLVQKWGWYTLLAGFVIIIVGSIARNPRIPQAAISILLMITAILCVNAVPLEIWNQQGTWLAGGDDLVAHLGVAIEKSTPPKTIVAVTGAGNITYFDSRDSIDLLGYSDHFIALTKPHTWLPFQPGHDKWDYDYSIGHLKPDIVVGIYFPSSTDLAHLKTWGYVSQTFTLAGTIYYLPGHFDPVAFDRALIETYR